MKFKKIIAIVLMTCFTFNVFGLSHLTAKAQTIVNNEIIYVDGIGYKTSLDKEGNFTLKALSSGKNSAYITVHSDGTADASISNKGVIENYKLDIQELNQESIDIDVYDKNSKVKVKEYKSLHDLNYDNYEGQTFGDFLVFSLSLLLNILLTLIVTIIILGVTYYSIVSVIETIREVASQSQTALYYRARIDGPQVLIDLQNPIPQTAAVSRLVGGNDIYTFYSLPAQIACEAVGGAGNSVGPEIDQNRQLGYVYFYHYHVNRTNPAHAFFGLPFTL